MAYFDARYFAAFYYKARYFAHAAAASNDYFVDAIAGSDANDGFTPATAWQTITKVNASVFLPGNTISFKRGQTHSGALVVPSSGSAGLQIVFGDYGSGALPIISSGASSGITIYNLQYITVQNLHFVGSGSGQGVNIYKDAVSAHHQSIKVLDVECESYGTGISIGVGAVNGYNDVLISNPSCHGNGTGIFAGSDTGGDRVITNLIVTGGSVYSNTLNGTVIGNTTTGEIKFHETYQNGGSSLVGPVGCWMYECTDFIIHDCESHHNESGNGLDGGGFDIDGGCINCTVEYSYAHDNHGPGFFVFCFVGSAATTGAVVRFNVSQNDATSTNSLHAGITVSTAGPSVAAEIHNNTIYMTTPTQYAARFTNNSFTVVARFTNNIFMTAGAAGGFIDAGTGATIAAGASFFGNDYFGVGNIKWNAASYASVALWRAAVPAQETIAAVNVSQIVDPRLVSAGGGGTIHAVNANLSAYKLYTDSPMIGSGLDIQAVFGINPGPVDYYGVTVAAPWNVGASYDTTPVPPPTPGVPVGAEMGSSGNPGGVWYTEDMLKRYRARLRDLQPYEPENDYETIRGIVERAVRGNTDEVLPRAEVEKAIQVEAGLDDGIRVNLRDIRALLAQVEEMQLEYTRERERLQAELEAEEMMIVGMLLH